MPEGRKNAYRCDQCLGLTITIEIDEGVVPQTIACRASGSIAECDGTAHSLNYPSEPWPEIDGNGVRIPADPAWEWYLPRNAALASWSQENRAVEAALEPRLEIRSIRARLEHEGAA